MLSFKIIPVIDLLRSEAVHALKGERVKYQPLKSKLFNSSNPIKIIEVLRRKFNFQEFYIADLDAIVYKNPNIKLLSKMLEIPHIKIMLDPGIKNKEDLFLYSNLKMNKLILGLETIQNYSVIKESLNLLGSNKTIVSIDMYDGKIISNILSLKNQNPIKIIDVIEHIGVKVVILLDLFRVGQKLGGIPPLYLEIRDRFKGDILVGGGIKNLEDIKKYREEKFSGILIATALYDGSLNFEDFKDFR